MYHVNIVFTQSPIRVSHVGKWLQKWGTIFRPKVSGDSSWWWLLSPGDVAQIWRMAAY